MVVQSSAHLCAPWIIRFFAQQMIHLANGAGQSSGPNGSNSTVIFNAEIKRNVIIDGLRGEHTVD